MAPHPLDVSPLRDRLVLLRTLCGGLMLAMAMVTALIVMVVWFALDGQPIAGNAVRVGGVSAVTLAAVAVAVVVPPVGLLFARRQWEAEVAALSGSPSPAGGGAGGGVAFSEDNPSPPPPPPTGEGGQDADAARLTAASTRVFLEFAPALSAGAACALSYHLTADAALLAAVAGLELFLLARFPTRRRVARLIGR